MKKIKTKEKCFCLFYTTKNNNKTETVDSYDSLENAELWLKKFQQHTLYNKFWISKKCTKEWRELFGGNL